MDELFTIAPYLLPTIVLNKHDIEKSEEDEIPFEYAGLIECAEEFYYIKLEGTINKQYELLSITLQCEPRLESLLLDSNDSLKERLDNCNTVQDVVFELKNFIEKVMKQYDGTSTNNQAAYKNFIASTKIFKRIKNEIESIGWDHLTDASEDFRELTFKYNENSRSHLLKINLTNSYPKSKPIIQVNLPIKFEFDWLETSSLKEMYQKFIDDINNLAVFWDEMKSIDENCWILEPSNPNYSDKYRRINLMDNVSIMITVDPRNPKEIPEITFLGPEMLTEKYKKAFQENYNEWNNSFNLLFNLEEVFKMKFPQKDDAMDTDDIQDTNLECSICYSYLLDNQGPNIYCEQVKCNKCFHQPCLYEWLKGISTSKIMFGYIYGECPYCNESIKCKIDT